jgi:uncharacterized protein HemX
MAEMKKKGNGMLVGGIALAVAVAGGILLAGFIQKKMASDTSPQTEA